MTHEATGGEGPQRHKSTDTRTDATRPEEFGGPTSHPPADRTVHACPECDSAEIRARVSVEPEYLCRDCRAEFDDPVARTPNYGGTERDPRDRDDVDLPALVAEHGPLYVSTATTTSTPAIHTDADCIAIKGHETRRIETAPEAPLRTFLCSHCDPAVATDGGEEFDPEPPHVTVGDRVTAILQHDGDAEYVEAVVGTVHSSKTIDAVYRVESRAEHGGDGSFERDHHTDRYEFQTSLVYMADIAGWLKGWDDA